MLFQFTIIENIQQFIKYRANCLAHFQILSLNWIEMKITLSQFNPIPL